MADKLPEQSIATTEELSLHFACYNNFNEVRRLILEQNVDPNQVNPRGFVPLFFACIANNAKCVKFLLSNGANSNVVIGNNFSLLHIACMLGHLKCIKLLLKHNCEVNAIADNKSTALHYAVAGGFIEVVDYLLEHGADVTVNNIDNSTAWDLAVSNEATEQIIHRTGSVSISSTESSSNRHKIDELLEAAYLGDESEVRRLILRENVDPNCRHLHTDETPLHRAAEWGWYNVLKVLLENNADVNAISKSGENALHVICERGYLYSLRTENHVNCVKLLLDCNININAVTNKGKTAMHIAYQKGYYQIVEVLLESKANINAETNEGKTVLHMACEKGHLKIVHLLLFKNAHINAATNEGKSPLHVACETSNLELTQLLLSNFVDVNLITKDGKTALFIACEKDNLKIVKLLLEHRVINVNIVTSEGKSPLHAACKNNNFEIVRLLLSRNSDVNVIKKDGKNALFIACEKDNSKMFDMLVEYGADVTTTANDGRNCLHVACANNNFKIVQFLLEKDVIDINAMTNLKNTALHISCRGGFFRITKLLLKSGADPLKINSDGRTPWEVVVKCGNQWKLHSLKSALNKKSSKYGKASLKLDQQKTITRSASVPVQIQQPKIIEVQSDPIIVKSTNNLDKIVSKFTKVQMIIEELMKTEATYISTLASLIKFYLIPLEDPSNKIPVELRGQSNKIFGNIRELHELHSMQIFPDMIRAYNFPAQISQVFNKNRNDLTKLYATYCIDVLPEAQSLCKVNKIDTCKFVRKVSTASPDINFH
ncbi:RhoGEF domain protein [Aphelenchoides bicaudatus]|nr:RhoGEF domain protein [Aphelenchoides bicaudatus]